MAIAVAGTTTFGSGGSIQGAGSTSSGTYTAAAGSNRLLVICIHSEDLTTSVAFNPAFGGVSFQDASSDPNGGASGTYHYVGYILEANIPSGAQSIVITNDTGASWTTNRWAGTLYTLTGCAQTGQPDPAAAEANHITGATSHTTANVTSVTDGILIADFCVATAGGHDAGATITGYTENDVIAEGGGSWISGYKLISSGTSESATFDWNGQNQTGGSILVGFGPATGGLTDVNLQGVNRGISRGVARGVG